MVTSLWPWLAVAGLGALHGLSPATGWMFAAAWGVRTGKAEQGAQVRRALLPIAIGHAASVAVVACAVAQGLAMIDRGLTQGLAGALLVCVAAWRWMRGAGPCRSIGEPVGKPMATPAGHAGIALWSFLMATAHGAGMMLVPALVPLCLADSPAREITASGSMVLAGAAVGVHTAAMLVATGVIAMGVCRGASMHPRLLSSTATRHAWTAALGITGALLIAIR
jgi:hypothetical protein